ncbi:MAG TPA: MBL fold metallo-hydrolase [Fimbriimonadaceae bacterium]|nr:MBL fold metallo-hydrolase [Fimbriimonadaceae bacterium]
MPEVVVLGSGTSNGVPSIGKEYPSEFLANPKNHRTRPSIAILGPEGNVLVDCAPELRLQLLRERIMMIHSVIVTHTHADHVMGMDDLRAFCLITKRDMPIYTTPEYQADIRRIFKYAFDEFPTGEVPRYDLRDIPEVLEICGLSIRVMTVMHGPIPVLALRINDFAYLTDLNHIPPEAERHLGGLDTLILDAVRYKPHPNHYNYEQAIAKAQEIGARKTYFTHLSDNYDHDKTNAELPEGIELAYDGLRIPI